MDGRSFRKERRLPLARCDPRSGHVYAALADGDIDLEALLEFVLQFAAYYG